MNKSSLELIHSVKNICEPTIRMDKRTKIDWLSYFMPLRKYIIISGIQSTFSDWKRAIGNSYFWAQAFDLVFSIDFFVLRFVEKTDCGLLENFLSTSQKVLFNAGAILILEGSVKIGVSVHKSLYPGPRTYDVGASV